MENNNGTITPTTDDTSPAMSSQSYGKVWFGVAGVIAIAVAIGFFFLTQRSPEKITSNSLPSQSPSPTQSVVVIKDQKEVEAIDVGDIDADMAGIQKDVNQL